MVPRSPAVITVTGPLATTRHCAVVGHGGQRRQSQRQYQRPQDHAGSWEAMTGESRHGYNIVHK